MSGMNHIHEGATEQWSPKDWLAAAPQSPELMPARVGDSADLAEFFAALDEIETRMVLALDEAVERALTRLERTR